MYKFDVEKTTNALINWIWDWFNKNGKDSYAVLGMSGGKDSTICAALLAKALKSMYFNMVHPSESSVVKISEEYIKEHLRVR